MKESEFQSRVIETAKWHGWLAAHFRPALQKSGKWATPVQGDKGFPDLTLARDGRVLFVELKTNTGRLTADQKRWATHLGDAYRLWRPTDWPDAHAELARVNRSAA